MSHTWEQLSALADARQKREAAKMLKLMVAINEDAKAWNKQFKELQQIIKDE